MNAYAPATDVVRVPTAFEAALYNVTTTFDSPISPPSCCPLPFASTHVKSPKLAGR